MSIIVKWRGKCQDAHFLMSPYTVSTWWDEEGCEDNCKWSSKEICEWRVRNWEKEKCLSVPILFKMSPLELCWVWGWGSEQELESTSSLQRTWIDCIIPAALLSWYDWLLLPTGENWSLTALISFSKLCSLYLLESDVNLPFWPAALCLSVMSCGNDTCAGFCCGSEPKSFPHGHGSGDPGQHDGRAQKAPKNWDKHRHNHKWSSFLSMLLTSMKSDIIIPVWNLG